MTPELARRASSGMSRDDFARRAEGVCSAKQSGLKEIRTISATATPLGGKYDVQEAVRGSSRPVEEQSRHMSNAAQMAMLKPYQQIIGMGEAAVPLILEQLQRDRTS